MYIFSPSEIMSVHQAHSLALLLQFQGTWIPGSSPNKSGFQQILPINFYRIGVTLNPGNLILLDEFYDKFSF